MILAYAQPGAALPYADSLAGVQHARDWPHLLAELPGARCAVVLFPLINDRVRSLLTDARAHGRHVPLILVTRPDPESLRSLCEIDVDAVLWPEELLRNLRSTVADVCVGSPLRRVGQALQQAECLPATFRHSLARACIADDPVLSVQGLARNAGCTRQAFWAYWDRAFACDDRPDPYDFVRTILLLRAIQIRVGHEAPPWKVVARQLGVSMARLRRTARSITGASTLSDLQSGPLHRLLVERFIHPLVSPDTSTDGS